MSRFMKLLMRIKAMSKDMRFEEVRKVLETYGYKMSSPSKGSSHRTFRKKGKPPITIPENDPVKRVYVIMVKEAVEEIERGE